MDARWHVRYAADLTTARTVRLRDGELLLRGDALRLVLFDNEGIVLDAKAFREHESVDIGDIVAFPCFFARVVDRILAPARPIPRRDGVNPTRPAAVVHDFEPVVHGTGGTRRVISDPLREGPSRGSGHQWRIVPTWTVIQGLTHIAPARGVV